MNVTALMISSAGMPLLDDDQRQRPPRHAGDRLKRLFFKNALYELLAERDKIINVIAARKAAETEAMPITVMAEAENQAANNKAEAITMLAKADADAAITAAWQAAGGDTGPLGPKDGGVYPAGDGFGQNFPGGKIFFTPAAGAHVISRGAFVAFLADVKAGRYDR